MESKEIAIYEQMAKCPTQYRSLQAFTSCSRNREVAEMYGNTLFIMKVLVGFVADISALFRYKNEEEELVAPGICFSARDVKFDSHTKKYLITLELRQRWSSKHKNSFLIVFLIL